jgi:hypothetical protein
MAQARPRPAKRLVQHEAPRHGPDLKKEQKPAVQQGAAGAQTI